MAGSAIGTPGQIVWKSAFVPGAEQPVPVRILRPAAGHRGWLVWAHGGSWRSGSAEGWHRACADLAVQAACTVVSVDYRLSPEHRHPAALQDVLAVLDWAQERAEEEGLPPVAVGGDSAGGTLAALAALVRRDRGQALSAQVLAYPPLDPECRAPSYTRYLNNFPTQESLVAAWEDFRGTDGAGGYPSTPFEVEDLGALAPAILGVGALDPVADDVRDFARRLRAAGNEVVFQEFPQMLHAAFLMPQGQLRQWLGAALRLRLLAPGPSRSNNRSSSSSSAS
ncbi:alpha/beta hydrolase [Kitasatospora sp. NPDC057223]|uniref:alpha/beta hydrolase n=1 Tax=Kitasatospora sp. NPDC057223 TaxID=3346055 RepID=UPI00362BEFE9